MRAIGMFTAGLVLAAAAAAHAQPSTIPANGGSITITPIKHASFTIQRGTQVIEVDPLASNPNGSAPKADLILVTDIHGDHMDAAQIAAFRKPDTTVIVPAAVRDALGDKLPAPTVMANGETKTVAGVQIEAVPMYNLVRGPSAGKLFHDKGRGNGYILTIGGKRLYIAGDTECTAEMKALKNIDAAFIPMNLPYTMTPAEAADCVKAFMPKVVYPYHYGQESNADEFAAALKGVAGVEVRRATWYPK